MDSPGQIIEQAASNLTAPITLHVERIGFSEQFTKTLFVEFAESPQLSAVSNALKRLSSARREYELKPHLSLIYQHLSEAEKRAPAQKITIPFSEVAFDEIKVISGPAHTTLPSDVESWRIIHSYKLPGV